MCADDQVRPPANRFPQRAEAKAQFGSQRESAAALLIRNIRHRLAVDGPHSDDLLERLYQGSGVPLDSAEVPHGWGKH